MPVMADASIAAPEDRADSPGEIPVASDREVPQSSTPTSAEVPAQEPGGSAPEEDCSICSMSFHIDQDLFLPIPNLNEDRDYTMGFMLSWNGDKTKGFSRFGYKLLDVIHAPLQPLMTNFRNTYYTTSVGISAFTPDDLTAVDPITEDRPYASLLYLTTSQVYANPGNDEAFETSLTLGALGLPLAEWGQTGFHKAWRGVTGDEEPFDPEGWHNQVSDGGEPTMMYRAAWYRRVPTDRFKFLDIAYSAEATLGYMTSASAGIVMRLGQIDKSTPVWNVVNAANYQSNTNQYVAVRQRQHQVYFLAGLRGSLVGYNALLQCQFRDSAHCLSSDQVKDFVFDVSAGFGWTFGRDQSKNLIFTCNSRTTEHVLTEKRTHHWCGFNISWRR
ncbi:hypothetical protein GCM10017044_01690 [Kordiimonas sediminis]|uniref:Lipid A deacylase LpxR family protein n=2 Tax=Kordiimonas sediminis TaxID=1735581 RepID=A0A919ALI4_9PROT|nr:hypothetical protein GCM10017044_01690 [Kordiimonas sediminis]